MDADPDSGAWELADFLAHHERDREAGIDRTLADYQQLYAHHPALIAREFFRLRDRPTASETIVEPGPAPMELGPYRLIEEIGQGGQGRVFLAEDRRLGRRVALKVLASGSFFRSPEAERRFRREAAIVSRLDHPGICTLYDVGAERGTTWIAMRYLEGESLAARIRRFRDDSALRSRITSPTRVRETVELVARAARAVQAAHDAHVVHRDLKPGNVMVTPSGDPVVLDFGLAKTDDDSSLTRTDVIVGTPAYMAPEALRGDHGFDPRTDVWSLGVTLYEALTLARPFDAPTHREIVERVLGTEAPDPRRSNQAIPRDLVVVLATALAKEPSCRYATAAAFAEDLEAILAGRAIRARRPSPLGRFTRWVRREPAWASLALTLAVAIPLLASAATYWWSTRGTVASAAARRTRDAVERALERGFSEIGEGSPERALAAFARASALEPGNPEARAGVALVHLERQQPERALFALQENGGAHGDGVLRRLTAQALDEAGRSTEAEAVRLRLGEPKAALDHFAAGLSFLRRGHAHDDLPAYRAAVDHFLAATLGTGDVRRLYHFELAHAVGHARNPEFSHRIAAAIVQLWPDSAEAARAAAIAVESTDLSRAIDYYRSGVALDPSDARVHYGLAVVLSKAGAADEARMTVDRALELAPDDAHAHFLLGRLLEQAQDAEAAIAAYRRSSELRPDAGMPLNNLGCLLLRRGDAEEALATLERAAALKPNSATILVNLGYALEAAGRLDAAQERYEEAERADATAPEPPFNLGAIQEQLAHYTEAARSFERADRLAAAKGGWTFPSAERAKACQAAAATEARLVLMLDDPNRLTDAAELSTLAAHCRRAERPLTEARLWRGWLARTPPPKPRPHEGPGREAATSPDPRAPRTRASPRRPPRSVSPQAPASKRPPRIFGPPTAVTPSRGSARNSTPSSPRRRRSPAPRRGSPATWTAGSWSRHGSSFARTRASRPLPAEEATAWRSFWERVRSHGSGL